MEATEERLTIIVEDRFDIHMWKGDFTSKYIEEISKKTGKERPYSVFIQLLVTALQNQKGSNTIYIDLLAFEDL
jgi:coiled-coil domain-containing protein 61